MSAIKEYEWLDISDDQKSCVVQELKNWHQAEILNLAAVIKGQLEQAQLVDNGWHELWCLDCEKPSESVHGTVEEAAEEFFGQGWAVNSLERFTAICKQCSNAPDTSTWASQYEDERGLLG